MILFGDYHTHTTNSDGHNSVSDVINSAADRGLREVAITDHGYSMRYPTSLKKIIAIREEAAKLAKQRGISALIGIEANLLTIDGNIDLPIEDFEHIDIVLLGYHFYSSLPNLAQYIDLYCGNGIAKAFPTTQRRKRNTAAYIKAIERYPIDVIVHPNHHFVVNVKDLAKCCKDNGTFIEFSARHQKMSESEISDIVGVGTGIVISSDGHLPSEVGDCESALAEALKLGIPESQIANLKGRPKFRNKNDVQRIAVANTVTRKKEFA